MVKNRLKEIRMREYLMKPQEFAKLIDGKKIYEIDDNAFEALGHLNS
ncbi:hypothetical protein ACTQ4K_18600 [Clostridium sporogenes]